VPIKPKAFETLLMLVETSGKEGGRLVSKDDLIEKLWANRFVEEGNLTFNIFQVRKALGDSPNSHRYVVTVPGQGYRFVAEIREFSENAENVIAQHDTRANLIEKSSQDISNQTYFRKLSRFRVAMPAAFVLLVSLAAVGYYVRSKRSESLVISGTTGHNAAIRSIAVLPFKPVAVEGRDASLELGMADSLIMRLSTLRQITVRPLSAVRRFTALDQDSLKAGQELQVESVLEGSVERLQERVRVRVRLLQVDNGQVLWAEQLDEKFSDIFTVQDSISQKVTAALALRLTGEEEELLAKHHTNNADAYRAYLLGRYFWEKSTQDDAKKSIGYFEQAINLDPNFALAYCGLAESYSALGSFGVIPLDEAQQKTFKYAARAVELDDKLAEAHASMAGAFKYYYWDWAEAEKQFRRAIALNPNYAQVHQWYGWSLACVGRFDEAIAEAKRAQELDPLSLNTNGYLAQVLLAAGDHDGALNQLQKTLELDSNSGQTHLFLGMVYIAMRKYDEAILESRLAKELSVGFEADAVALLGYAYAASGQMKQAQENLNELDQMSKRHPVAPFLRAVIYSGLGNKDRTFAWLERAYRERDWHLWLLKVAPVFDGIRSDPRFAELLTRMKLS
jgi:TolB-like protein/Flp pilus assembly protein TadD